MNSILLKTSSIGDTLGQLLGGVGGLVCIKIPFLVGITVATYSVIYLVYAIKTIYRDTLKIKKQHDISFKREKSWNVIIRKKFIRAIRVSIMMAFIAFGIASPLNQHWQIFFHELGISNNFVLANIYTIRTILIILGGNIAKTISYKIKKTNLFIFRYSILISAAALFLCTITTNYIGAILFWSIISISNTVARVFFMTELIEVIPKERRATLLSVNSLIFSSGSFLGGITIGYIADRFTLSVGWRFCVIAFVIAFIVALKNEK